MCMLRYCVLASECLMSASGVSKCFLLKHNYMTKVVWYRRNVFKKVCCGVPKSVIYKLSLGTDNALYFLSTAVLRNLESIGGINW